MNHYMLFFLTADLSLGRVDKESLSQQTLMEILVANITNKEKICGSEDESKDILEWKGVKCNWDNEITSVVWRKCDLRGSISLEWLPTTIDYMSAGENKLSGSVDLEHLPNALKELYLYENMCTGSVCLTKLPPKIEILCLRHNTFSGAIDLTKLPDSLTLLFLNNNQFEGETDFSQFPKGMFTLNVSKNMKLSGTLFVGEGNIFRADYTKVEIVRVNE